MLLKGCQKRSVCLRTSDSRLFEEAFFVLRGDTPAATEEDIVAEANRILEENLQTKRSRRHPRPMALILAFLAGGVTATALVLLLGAVFA